MEVARPRGDGPRVRLRDILRIREIRVVTLATFVVMLGYDAVGLLVSAFAATRLVFDLVAGALVNRFGERAIVGAGAVVVGVSSAAAAMAPTFPLLVAFRAAGGAGSSVFFAALMSYILRTSPQDRLGRVMGVFYGAFNVGVIVGNPIGGLVAHLFGLASPLWFYAGACFVAAAMYVRTVRDDPARPADGGRRPGLRDLTWDRPFFAVLLANGAYFWFASGVISTLLSLFGHDRLGLSPAGIGLVLSVLAVAEFAVLFPAGSMVDRLGRKAVLLPGLVATAAVTAVTGFASSVVPFAIVLGVMGVASGFGGVPQPVMLADVVPLEHRPAAIGVYRFVGDLGFVGGPLLAGAVASTLGFEAAFAVSAIPCVLAAALVATVPETSPRRRPAKEPSP